MPSVTPPPTRTRRVFSKHSRSSCFGVFAATSRLRIVDDNSRRLRSRYFVVLIVRPPTAFLFCAIDPHQTASAARPLLRPTAPLGAPTTKLREAAPALAPQLCAARLVSNLCGVRGVNRRGKTCVTWPACRAAREGGRGGAANMVSPDDWVVRYIYSHRLRHKNLEVFALFGLGGRERARRPPEEPTPKAIVPPAAFPE